MLTPRRTCGKPQDMAEKIVIIGAGQAGAQAVQSLRAEGFEGPITMVGDESFPPYQRPPLSKAYLLGSFERPRLFLKADNYYAESRLRVDPKHQRQGDSSRRASGGTDRWPQAVLRQTAAGDRRAGAQAEMYRRRSAGRALSQDHRRCGRAAARFPCRQAHRHCGRRLYRSGSGGGRRQARAGRHGVRGHGPADGARRLARSVGFLCR